MGRPERLGFGVCGVDFGVLRGDPGLVAASNVKDTPRYPRLPLFNRLVSQQQTTPPWAASRKQVGSNPDERNRLSRLSAFCGGVE
jgi:hypothetical protein